jgi:nucleotidyltransferase AbiEii toxin of type IV toxin-antitoxin system
MKLREQPSDLRDALDVAAGSLGLTVRQLEKDYWVTEVLRTLAARHRTSVLFKGGTSLSKGWRIIRRFSEDIDLLLTSEPGPATDSLLDQIVNDAVSVCGRGASIVRRVEGLARVVDIPYPELPNTPRSRGLRRTILLEPGVRGGPRPHESVEIAPFLADGLSADATGQYEDLQPFVIEALHPARTMVEKLFAADGLAKALQRDPDRRVVGTEARHFYDLYCLADPDRHPALDQLTDHGLYLDLIADCEAISARWFPDRADVRPQDGFRHSPAFVDDTVADRIRSAFQQTMDELCFPGAPRPTFDDVRQRLSAIDWL